MNLSFNVPGTLLGIWLVWYALTRLGELGSTNLFGLFTLVTGIIWLVVSLGLVARMRG